MDILPVENDSSQNEENVSHILLNFSVTESISYSAANLHCCKRSCSFKIPEPLKTLHELP